MISSSDTDRTSRHVLAELVESTPMFSFFLKAFVKTS